MKYIRTKDGIYKVVEWLDDGRCKIAFFPNSKQFTRFTRVIDVNDILNKADTIEELRDEFRYEDDNCSNHEKCWKYKSSGKWYDYDVYVALDEKEIATIKGAIWTSKGLIYVAKMNDKGELELI